MDDIHKAAVLGNVMECECSASASAVQNILTDKIYSLIFQWGSKRVRGEPSLSFSLAKCQ